MSPYISLFFDIVIVAALAATIHHALRLSKQFSAMQADRKAFEALIQALNLASSRAEAAIRVMKEAASGSGEQLQEKTNKARAMAEELQIMIQAGDNLAERLNKLATESRKAAIGDGDFTDIAEDKPKAAAEPRTKAEKELLEALRARNNNKT